MTLAGHRLYLDANVFIYAVERVQDFPTLRRDLFDPLERGEFEVVTSWIGLAEALVKPLRDENAILEQAYRELIRPTDYVSVLAVSCEVASRAAQIRSEFNLKLPDAIHIATGIGAGCSVFVTADTAWSRARIAVIDPSSIGSDEDITA